MQRVKAHCLVHIWSASSPVANFHILASTDFAVLRLQYFGEQSLSKTLVNTSVKCGCDSATMCVSRAACGKAHPHDVEVQANVQQVCTMDPHLCELPSAATTKQRLSNWPSTNQCSKGLSQDRAQNQARLNSRTAALTYSTTHLSSCGEKKGSAGSAAMAPLALKYRFMVGPSPFQNGSCSTKKAPAPSLNLPQLHIMRECAASIAHHV